MAATNVSVSGEVSPLTEMHLESAGESLFTKGLCSCVFGDSRLLSEVGEFVHGPFKRTIFFLLCLMAFLGIFPFVVNSQKRQIL